MQIETLTFRQMPCLRLQAKGASALVALQGAQVLSWIAADGRERLFLGERAQFSEGVAIRGGIPVIFPQFGARGPLRKHGFARLRPWRFAGRHADAAQFELAGAADDGEWPSAFRVRLCVEVEADALRVALQVDNAGEQPFEFSAALHSYLHVEDGCAASLHGLGGLHYEDSAAGGAPGVQQAPTLQFEGELDRIYGGATKPLTLHDGPHRLRIAQTGFADVVIWNPGAALAARIDDLAPDEYRRFVCVEAAQVLQPIQLAPRASWCAAQRLSILC